MKTLLCLCLLVIAAYSKVTPSSNFNLTDFSGVWNLAAIVGTPNIGLYSCAKLDVTLGLLNKVTLNQTWIDTTTNAFTNSVERYLPDVFDSAYLISTSSPSSKTNYVVSYYNTTAGHAILINEAASKAFVLTRNDSYNDAVNFNETINSVLTQAGIALSSVIQITNSNCDYKKLTPSAGFQPSSIIGPVYYANIAYQEQGFVNPDNYCNTMQFSADGAFVSVVYTESHGKNGTEVFLPYPGLPSVFIDTEISYSQPFTIVYQDPENNVFLAFREPLALAFSNDTSVKLEVVSNVFDFLEAHGFTVSDINFKSIPPTCYPQNERVDNIIVN